MHLLRNAFSWTRSHAVQRPDHAGAAYCILDSIVARNTSFRDCWGNPWDLSTRRAYNSLVHDLNSSATWSVAVMRLLTTTPSTVILSTCSMFRHGGGNWIILPVHKNRLLQVIKSSTYLPGRVFVDTVSWQKCVLPIRQSLCFCRTHFCHDRVHMWCAPRIGRCEFH